MSNDLSMEQLLVSLDDEELPVLATIDGERYEELSVVVRRVIGGALFYCLRRDWETTQAAQIARRDERIAGLEAELAALRAAMPPPRAQPDPTQAGASSTGHRRTPTTSR